MNKKHPVIAIGLDSAEPSLLEKWMSQGYLPNLSRLREKGIYGRLENFRNSNVETAWTTFATGCSPEQTGFWAFIRFKKETYETKTCGAYDYQEYPPFYALGEPYRIVAFDVPQVRLTEKIKGIQIAGWGSHSPQVESGSLPENLWQEVIHKHGISPTLHRDYAICLDLKGTLSLEEPLKIGIQKRSAICQDLLRRENWDLFLTVFNDPHSAGHIFWQLSQPDHPLYETLKTYVDHDPLLSVFQKMDQAIGEILAQVSDDAYIIIFSGHGMRKATIDLPSFVLLPEFLYRFNFPGKYAIGYTNPLAPLPPPVTRMQWNYWERHLWGDQFDPNRIRKFLRKETPTRLFSLIESLLDSKAPSGLVSPWELARQGDRVLPWNPVQWYKRLWRSMKAFALPSFAEGYIRINLKGREPQGLVAPSEYHTLCDEICEKLNQLRDPRHNVPMVSEIVRTRQNPLDDNPKLPDADLIVVWQEEYATDVMDSPEYGRIGPLPFYRAGSHREQGFILASGEDIKPNSHLSQGHVLDLGPTILSLMGADIPDYLQGQPLSLFI